MSSNTEILSLPPPEPCADSQPLPESQPRSRRSKHRRSGKVASLPKVIRDKINVGMEDGVQYNDIIERLGPEGLGLNFHHLSEWKTNGGYQDYLDDKFWRQQMAARCETFNGLNGGSDALELPEAGLQMAVLGACELLRDLSALTSEPDGKIDADQYVRISNALARLSRSVLALQLHRDAAAKAKKLEAQRAKPDRASIEKDRQELLDRADELFGFKPRQGRETDPLAPQPLTVPPASPVPQASPPASPEASPPRSQIPPIIDQPHIEVPPPAATSAPPIPQPSPVAQPPPPPRPEPSSPEPSPSPNIEQPQVAETPPSPPPSQPPEQSWPPPIGDNW